MGKSLEEVIQILPAVQQAAVESRFQQLYAKELSLHDLPRVHELTQGRMTEPLYMRQESKPLVSP